MNGWRERGKKTTAETNASSRAKRCHAKIANFHFIRGYFFVVSASLAPDGALHSSQWQIWRCALFNGEHEWHNNRKLNFISTRECDTTRDCNCWCFFSVSCAAGRHPSEVNLISLCVKSNWQLVSNERTNERCACTIAHVDVFYVHKHESAWHNSSFGPTMVNKQPHVWCAVCWNAWLI